VRSAEHHAGPVRDKCLRRSEPQTAAAPGDEVNPAVQSKIHPAILPEPGSVGRQTNLAHRYFDTDHLVLQATVGNDLPELERAVHALAETLPTEDEQEDPPA
jgi:hypothetical protein